CFRPPPTPRPPPPSLHDALPIYLSIMRPRSPLLSPSTRARASPWSARCYGVARQPDRSRQNSRGPRACFLSGISGSRVGAEESRSEGHTSELQALRYRACRLGLE